MFVGTQPFQLEPVPLGDAQAVFNEGGNTLYYGTSNAVSSVSNSGSIASGATGYIPNNATWVVSTGVGTTIAIQTVVGSFASLGLRAGLATLVAGTVTVADPTVDANSIIVVARQVTGGTVGNLSITQTPGTGFTINSSSGTETSTCAYIIVEAA